MVILLSIEESPDQIVSGFPEYVILETNIPSTIFYTLDGTDPSEESEIFIDKLLIPTTGLTTTLKAIAITGLVSSSILEEIYSTDHSDLGKSRYIGKEGINILPAGVEPVDSLSFSSDGDIAQASVLPFVGLDLIASRSNEIGKVIPDGTTIDFIRFPIKVPIRKIESDEIVSTPNDNINFNPKASYITIDGTTEDAIANQTVRVINRPHGSMNLISQIYNQNLDEYQLTSSNFVRYMIDPKTGKITFYYRDSRENRWIRSTQVVEGKGLNLAAKASPPSSFVFRWIENRAQSKIY